MAKPAINGPTDNGNGSSAQYECRLALEPSLTVLAEAAAKVGWHPEMIAQSLMILSAQMLDQHCKGDQAPELVH